MGQVNHIEMCQSAYHSLHNIC